MAPSSAGALTFEREKTEYVRGWRTASPLVLLPGLFAGAWIWKPAWDRLVADGHSVVQVLDPFANLDAGPAPLDMLREWLLRLLDEHGISRAVLCGNSLGALAALDAAARHPGRVEAIVISGCPGLSETPKLGLSHSGGMPRENADRIANQLFYDRSAISTERIEQSYALARDRRSAANMLRYVVSIRKYDVKASLARIQCEALMIWGEQDRIAPAEHWERNLHLVAHASLHKLPQCGHSPMIEKPAEFNALLAEFLAADRR